MDKLDEHSHDIEYNYKDPEHPLQLVFVCAMWLTGFDAPTLSTLYLDKPMQGHTLMQTIARANRVTSWKINEVEKRNGEIVDYYNVFRNMKLALKDYAQGGDETEPPVKEKAELFRLLDDAIEQGFAFCHEKAVALREVLDSDDVFKQVGSFESFANTLLANDEWRRSFNVYENTITSLYEACKPEVLGRSKGREVAAFQYLRGVIEAHIEQKDIDAISLKIAELLDESVVVDGAEVLKAQQKDAEYQIIQKGKTWDLSKINFDKLREEFKQATYKHIEIADLRAFLQHKLELMLQQNATRTDFAQRLQQIIDTYNAGGSSTENYYEDLMQFTEDLRMEDERHIREGLTEDELELFDLLKKDKMTQEETQKVRLAAKSLLHRLLQEHPKVLVQDWYKDTQTQKMVRSAVEQVLDSNLPESYDRVLFREKCDNVFYLVLEYASHGRKWAA
jgi:type I restriction enzyme R subunit